jgi:hypothetical protein
VTILTLKSKGSNLKVAAFDPYRLTIEQRIRCLLPRCFQNSLEGGARDVHPLSALLLVQVLKVFEA